jgi:hypothetical protein
VGDWAAKQRKRDQRRRAAVMALPVLPVRPNGAITAAVPGDVPVSSSVGPDGEAVALWASADDHAAFTSTTTQPGWATFPDPRTPRPVPATVTVQGQRHHATVRIADLSLAHPTVHVLPGGRILVVAARCEWRPDGPEHNAIVYDPDGQPLLAETLGDGIEHVVTTRAGNVWVGYFDEGVYGNFGWGDEGAPPPLGAAGLMRFTDALQPDWTFPADNRWGTIDDCYALNVDGETAWACYYSDFPVVRADGDDLTGWRNDIASGVRALAVSDRRVALFGGYGPDHDRLVVGELGGKRVRHRGEYRLVLPDGSPLPTARVFGRGPTLHLLADTVRYRLDLDDIATPQHL